MYHGSWHLGRSFGNVLDGFCTGRLVQSSLIRTPNTWTEESSVESKAYDEHALFFAEVETFTTSYTGLSCPSSVRPCESIGQTQAALKHESPRLAIALSFP